MAGLKLSAQRAQAARDNEALRVQNRELQTETEALRMEMARLQGELDELVLRSEAAGTEQQDLRREALEAIEKECRERLKKCQSYIAEKQSALSEYVVQKQASVQAACDRLLADAEAKARAAEKALAEAERTQREAEAKFQSVYGDAAAAIEAEYSDRLKKCHSFIIQRYSELMDVVRMQSGMLAEAAKSAAMTMLLADEDYHRSDEIYASALQDQLLTNSVAPSMGQAGFVVISDPVELEALGHSGFRNNAVVRSVTLPEGMNEIPPSYFFGCISLREVVVPSTVTEIGSYAFFGCKQLESVRIRSMRLRAIGDFAFAGCEVLHDFEAPACLRTVGAGAFRYCGNLESVSFGEGSGLERLCNHAFQYCGRLGALTLPKGIRTVETSLFYGCTSLAHVRIPAWIVTVEGYAFAECTALRTLDFESEETILNPYALSGLSEHTVLSLRGVPLLRPHAEDQPVAVRQLLQTPAEPAAEAPAETAVTAEEAPAEPAAETSAEPVAAAEEAAG